MRPCHVLRVWLSILLLFLVAATCRADALARLTAERLEAVRQAVVKLRSQRQELVRSGPWHEYRANLHVHSALSHDSRGQIEDIVAAAKRTGTQVLLFSEHPADHYDFFKEGHQGIRDDVLLIPGAETQGLLVYPRQSIRGFERLPPQELSDLVRGRQGMTFLSHLEERMDWEIRNLTGLEIYNTHADFKDEKLLLSSLRNPLWLLGAGELFRKYPQEAYSALQDYPADYLRRYDQLCQKAPHTGISANDAHQNVGLTVRLLEGNRARVEDALGQKLLELDASALGELRPPEAKAGAVLFEVRLDRYEHSLRHVGTHLLLRELTTEAVWDALSAGRAFVAFDWMADSRGFEFFAQSAAGRHEMGSQVKFHSDLRLQGRAPLPATWKLIRNGQRHSESTGPAFEARVSEPGIYRIEVWLDIAGEQRVWILSNPLYIVAP